MSNAGRTSYGQPDSESRRTPAVHGNKHSQNSQVDNTSLSVAIIGGGIVGITLALGLIERGLQVDIYEKSPDFSEFGVGLAFTGVARRCMAHLSTAIVESLGRVANRNLHESDNYWDGYHQGDDKTATTNNQDQGLLFQLSNTNMAWWGCLRSQFINDMSRSLPPEAVHFKKELTDFHDAPLEGGLHAPVKLFFSDGTTSTADVLIGCDGIRSNVRQRLFSASHPQTCRPSYTHKTCYRAVIPMATAEAALGPCKSHNHCMHMGPRAHVLSYPVAQHTLLNVVVFVAQDEPWTATGDDKDVAVLHMTRPGARAELESRLANWCPQVRALIAQLPDMPTAWAVFDTAENPAPHYAQGRVCLAGDAAHASAPHHGAGAGMGVEDALALATSLGMVAAKEPLAVDTNRKRDAIIAALRAFEDIRYRRTQWLVSSSRETGDIYEWMHPRCKSDPAKLRAELEARQQVIWDFDVDTFIHNIADRYPARLGNDDKEAQACTK